MRSRRVFVAVQGCLRRGSRTGTWGSLFRHKIAAAVVFFGVIGLLAVSVYAEDFERMEAKVAHKMAKQLCQRAKRLENPQVHIDPDVTQAEGAHRDQDAGLIVVPRHGLKDDLNQNANMAKKDPGASLGYLFAYHIVPVIRDKSVPVKELRRVTVADDTGKQVQVNCMLLAVRRVTDDNWRLYVYGIEKRPVLDVPLQTISGSETAPLSVACKNVRGFEGDLEVTVFGHYRAKFKVRYQLQ